MTDSFSRCRFRPPDVASSTLRAANKAWDASCGLALSLFFVNAFDALSKSP